MRFVVIGYGVQGRKRKNILARQCDIVVDPISMDADYRDIREVPLDSFDAAIVSTPDSEKFHIIDYLVENRKHVLCEKPLSFQRLEDFLYLQDRALENKTIVYTAYNHRFERAIMRAKSIIDARSLGKIYLVRLLYGNGTAKLVAKSNWRDSDLGVISDLGSHCIDIVRYWFPNLEFTLKPSDVSRFENHSPDYAFLISKENFPKLVFELSLCTWKNQFRVEIVGEKGSLSIDGLKKWGRSELIKYQRVLPSGYPIESVETYDSGDETWNLEHDHFINLISNSASTDLKNDIFVFNVLHKIIRKGE